MYLLAILEKRAFEEGSFVHTIAGHMYSLAIFLTHATNLIETLACLYLLDSESPLAFFFLVIGFEPVVDGYIKLRLGDTKTPVDDFVYATVVQIFEAWLFMHLCGATAASAAMIDATSNSTTFFEAAGTSLISPMPGAEARSLAAQLFPALAAFGVLIDFLLLAETNHDKLAEARRELIPTVTTPLDTAHEKSIATAYVTAVILPVLLICLPGARKPPNIRSDSRKTLSRLLASRSAQARTRRLKRRPSSPPRRSTCTSCG